ncbi:MAG: phosphate-starvation-inducible PsiE family protein [Actinomycetota bacterium]|nr:phosphate-starvation-inducible PsiE family protein [Actinomycetota bacterium]
MSEQTKRPTSEREQTVGEDQAKGGEDYTKGGDDQAKGGEDRATDGRDQKSEGDVKSEQKAEKGAAHEDAVARVTSVGLHILEDIIYAVTAVILVGGAFLVLGHAIFQLFDDMGKGVAKATEAAMDSLLIVFILVELLSATRTAIDKHYLVAEPFLLVGILAAIKEIVVLATFRIKLEKPSELALKIGVLGGVVIAMAVATWILRRREREPKESES